jgi:hypothetical protein
MKYVRTGTTLYKVSDRGYRRLMEYMSVQVVPYKSVGDRKKLLAADVLKRVGEVLDLSELEPEQAREWLREEGQKDDNGSTEIDS